MKCLVWLEELLEEAIQRWLHEKSLLQEAEEEVIPNRPNIFWYASLQIREKEIVMAGKRVHLTFYIRQLLSDFSSLNLLICSCRWRDFSRSMFWLAVICGSLILLHALVLFILKFRNRSVRKSSYGALIFPRFEIFLLILALPCLCEASTTLVKGTPKLWFLLHSSFLCIRPWHRKFNRSI